MEPHIPHKTTLTLQDLTAEFTLALPIRLYTCTVLPTPTSGPKRTIEVHFLHRGQIFGKGHIELDEIESSASACEILDALLPLKNVDILCSRYMEEGRQCMRVVIPLRKRIKGTARITSRAGSTRETGEPMDINSEPDRSRRMDAKGETSKKGDKEHSGRVTRRERSLSPKSPYPMSKMRARAIALKRLDVKHSIGKELSESERKDLFGK